MILNDESPTKREHEPSTLNFKILIVHLFGWPRQHFDVNCSRRQRVALHVLTLAARIRKAKLRIISILSYKSYTLYSMSVCTCQNCERVNTCTYQVWFPRPMTEGYIMWYEWIRSILESCHAHQNTLIHELCTTPICLVQLEPSESSSLLRP